MSKIRLVSGIICILGLMGLFGFVIYYLWFELFESGGYYATNIGSRQLIVAMAITTISGLYFIISTILGGHLWSESRRLELQNRILKKKIEQRILLNELSTKTKAESKTD